MASIATLLPSDQTLPRLRLLLRGWVAYRLSQRLAGYQFGAHPPCARSLVWMFLLLALRVGRIPIGLGLPLPGRRLRYTHPQVSCFALLVYIDIDHHRWSTHTWNRFRVSLIDNHYQSRSTKIEIKTTPGHKIMYHIALYKALTSGRDPFQISVIWCVYMYLIRRTSPSSSSWQGSWINKTYQLF